MLTLKDKVAIVTGATSGIGGRIAEVFVGAGARVVLAARRREKGAELERALGGAATFVRVDVRVEQDLQRLIEQTWERFGRLDCLVNNAGTLPPAALLADIDLADFDDAIAMHVRSVVAGMKHAAPKMIARGAGSIINVGSIAGIRAGVASIPYSTAKAALLHLTRCVAIELGEHGVRVNSISPGPILTGIFAKSAGLAADTADRETDAIKAAFDPLLSEVQALPRIGLPDDIARAALYLASDDSSFVTGHDLVVDGGSVAGRPAAVMRRQHAALGKGIRTLGASFESRSSQPNIDGDADARISS